MKKTKRKVLDGAKWYEALIIGLMAGTLPTVLFLLAL